MKTLSFLVVAILALGVGCGGQAPEVLETEQATLDEYASPQTYLLPMFSTSGIVANGMLVNSGSYQKILYSAFHDGYSHWPPVTPGSNIWAYSEYADQTQWVNRYGTNSVNLFGVYTVSKTGFHNHPYYSSGFPGYSSGGSMTVAGAGVTCNANTMGTTPANWVIEGGPYQSSTPTMRKANMAGSGAFNFGSGNLCYHPIPQYNMEAFCYDYESGATCMWGDDGSLQMYYGYALLGLGFGNIGAAWVNNYVAGWLNNVI